MKSDSEMRAETRQSLQLRFTKKVITLFMRTKKATYLLSNLLEERVKQGVKSSNEEKAGRLMHDEGAHRNEGVAATEHDEHDPDGKPEEGLQAAVKEETNKMKATVGQPPERPGKMWREGVRKMSTMGLLPKRDEEKKPEEKPQEPKRHHGPARAYQFGNTIIVEDEDGEVIKKYDIPAPEGKQNTAPGQNATRQRLRQMSKMLGMDPRDDKVQPGDTGPSSAASPPGAPADKQRENQEGDDEDLRFATGGRRMSKAQFIDQIRDMDPKRRVQAVENSNAPDDVKREARKEAREQAGMTRSGTTTDVPVVQEDPEQEDALAAVERVNSHDSNQLKLVQSGGQEVPFHDVASQLKNYSMRSSEGETAAERRRRLALQQPAPEDDSDDDGTERVPPSMPAGPSQDERQVSENAETAAEKRRRLGALGMTREDDSDSEDEDQPREPPQKPNIRFADQSSPEPRPPRQSALRWGKNKGR